ncbi:MAG: ABC transporter permease [Trueperaceae bacterium]
MRAPGLAAVVGAVVAANVRRLVRDPIGMAFVFLVPFVLILVVGVTVPDADAPRPLGYVAGAGVPSGFAARLADDPMLRTVVYADVDALAGAVRRGHVAAGASTGVDASGAIEVVWWTDPGRAPDPALRAAVVVAVVGAATSAATPPIAVVERTLGAAERTRGGAGAPVTGGFARAAPAYLILFVFLNTLVAAWGLPADRASGVARRAHASPAGAGALVAGEVGYRFGLGLVQSIVVVAVGALLFGVAWGDPWAVAAIVVAFAGLSAAASVALGSWARTPEQVTSFAPLLGIALAMLGGCMWPLEAMGPTLRAVAGAVPHAYAVEAFQQVIGGGAGIGAIGPQLAALVAFGLGFAALAGVAYRASARG